jgi:hypothetical protein
MPWVGTDQETTWFLATSIHSACRAATTDSRSHEAKPCDNGQRPLCGRQGPLCWLPGVVSQSVILWDMADIEMTTGLNGHTQIRARLPGLHETMR